MIRLINRIRRSLYRAGILKAKRLPGPVVSIGNITMGGAGKTPAVIAIAKALTERGLRVAVLTRGHGRTGPGGVVDVLDAAKFGDEPVLIKKRVPAATVIVGANRYDNAIRFGRDAQVFLLDDGFQHLQVARDLDIVIDAPSRWHREWRGALRDADIVMPRDLRLSIPEEIRGKSIFAFAGLADNEQFFTALRKAGLDLAGTRGFPDHHRYAPADIPKAEIVVTTEKDAVKIADDSIIAIPAEMHIPPDVMERIVAVATR